MHSNAMVRLNLGFFRSRLWPFQETQMVNINRDIRGRFFCPLEKAIKDFCLLFYREIVLKALRAVISINGG